MSRFLIDYCNSRCQAGITAMLNNDSIPLFSGVTEAMKENLIIANMINVEDYRWRQMLTQLIQMERPGLSFFLVNRNFPAHITIQVSEGGIEAQNSLVQNAARVTFLCFNRLVLDPAGNIFLASEGVPQLISKWRESTSQIMEKHGGQPKPLQTLYSTVSSFTQAESLTNEERQSLVKFINDWNSDLQKSELRTDTRAVFIGTVYNLLKS